MEFIWDYFRCYLLGDMEFIMLSVRNENVEYGLLYVVCYVYCLSGFDGMVKFVDI